ncbi:MAG: hypothetical protein IPO26_18390 [Saprospiraceae bacterium]|nr:hypothetical protein [Saprospiraceae bacterium]
MNSDGLLDGRSVANIGSEMMSGVGQTRTSDGLETDSGSSILVIFAKATKALPASSK